MDSRVELTDGGLIERAVTEEAIEVVEQARVRSRP
jgi:hypothetical protein